MSTVLFRDTKSLPLTANVMVIDDQLTSRIIMESIINSIGDNINTKTYDNALIALDTAKNTPPDLIVVDYKMPKLNGIEFTSEIRRTPQCMDIPIIIFTIVDDKSVMYEALEAGATDFLTKPIDHYECKVRCRNLLTMRRQQIIIRERAASLEKLILNTEQSIQLRELETLFLVNRITDIKGDHSGYHPVRMGKVSSIISKGLGMDEEFCDQIEFAAPLHDIGEIRIPSYLLRRFGYLDRDEIDLIKEHTILGHELLNRSSSPVLQLAAIIALYHHERFDGQGYPNKITGTAIPIEARIVAVADAFDAITSHRSYRPAKSLDETLEILISEKGKAFDPECVDALIRNIDSLIEIDDHSMSS